MFDKLEAVELRFVEIENNLASGNLTGQELAKQIKERGTIAEVVETFRRYKSSKNALIEAREILANEADADLKAMAKEEIVQLESEAIDLEERLQVLTLPRDPNDDKNVIIEIRAGTGGDESALFSGDLLKMYSRYADRQGWRTEVLSFTGSAAGGFKEVIVLVSGTSVYSALKFESGVHRVQRVPQTETQGRIHTSACTVAILPEGDEIDEIELNSKDLEISTTRSSGAGGQHVNTTDSAIRIVHKPSGIAVECQAERSQHKNKETALKVLRAKLYDQAKQEQLEAVSADRKLQVGSGDRSEKIRTYNFPQGRVTDHRIGLTLYQLPDIMNGQMDEIVSKLAASHQSELLKQQAQQT